MHFTYSKRLPLPNPARAFHAQGRESVTRRSSGHFVVRARLSCSCGCKTHECEGSEPPCNFHVSSDNGFPAASFWRTPESVLSSTLHNGCWRSTSMTNHLRGGMRYLGSKIGSRRRLLWASSSPGWLKADAHRMRRPAFLTSRESDCSSQQSARLSIATRAKRGAVVSCRQSGSPRMCCRKRGVELVVHGTVPPPACGEGLGWGRRDSVHRSRWRTKMMFWRST